MIFTKMNSSNKNMGVVNSIFSREENFSEFFSMEEQIYRFSKIKRKNMFFLGSSADFKLNNFSKSNFFSAFSEANKILNKKYLKGKFNEKDYELIKSASFLGAKEIFKFVNKNKISSLILEDPFCPNNFLTAISVNEYYRLEKEAGRETPYLVVYWDKSYLSMEKYGKPSAEMWKLMNKFSLGIFTDFIVFRNSMEAELILPYFRKLEKISPGFSDFIDKNYAIIPDFFSRVIYLKEDLEKESIGKKFVDFSRDFGLIDEFYTRDVKLGEVIFLLHGSLVSEKTDLNDVLKYSYKLLDYSRKAGRYKAVYFFVSAKVSDEFKKKLMTLNSKLSKETGEKNVVLVFAQDYLNKTSLNFFDYPFVFARLGGLGVYSNKKNYFGRGLMRLFSSGLPVVLFNEKNYSDYFFKYNFKTIKLNSFKDDKFLFDSYRALTDKSYRKKIIDYNLYTINKNFDVNKWVDFLIKKIERKESKKK